MEGPEQGLGYFAQLWLHVQTLLCSVELLHTQAGMGRAGSSGRDVVVAWDHLSLSLAGWLMEAIMAQILTPCPVLPLPWAAATPHTSRRCCMNCSSFKGRFY